MNKDINRFNNVVSDARIAIIGLGYVGLPLAVEFAKKYPVVGYDVNTERVDNLNKGIDQTLEVEDSVLQSTLVKENPHNEVISIEEWRSGLYCSAQLNDIEKANIYIVTVPTPIDEFKAPDLNFLMKASETIGAVLKKGDIVIYESTVYPGCTEEDCVPVLEQTSGLIFNKDFYVGYSPERINPGDKVNTLTKIIKVTSGSTPEVSEYIDNIYSSIIEAGTHRAPSIKVAEASKAIENAQRDVNISFMNELALIFDRMEIDTNDVLEAAGTKFNFLKFKPGLVGGHCISVDPYYLTHKATMLGYHPEVILSGRRVNDRIGSFIAQKVVKLMIQQDIRIRGAKALILGITFKENCPDVRNTRVVDIYHELISYGVQADIYDPWADPEEVKQEYGVTSSNVIPDVAEGSYDTYDAIILAVAHDEFLQLDLAKFKNSNSVVFDCKGILDRREVKARL